MIEAEVKVKANIEDIRILLENKGYIKVRSVYEKDTYFNSDYVDLKENDKALRIREYRHLDSRITRYILNYKGPKLDDITMSREETEFEIPSFIHGNVLLIGLGYHEAGHVDKTRTVYKKNDISCCLDQVTGLGEFLEIEILTDKSGYSLAINRIEEVLKELGLSIQDSIKESYLCMLQKKEGLYE